MDWLQSGLVFVICVAASLGYGLLTLHAARQQRQIRQLSNQLEVFVDASIALGRSLDRLTTLQQDERVVRSVSSRRWLLREAKVRLQEGQTMEDVGASLGLSRDEMGLLEAGLKHQVIA